MKKLKSYSRLTLVFPVLLIFILNLFACALVRVKTYDETVSQWKSYEDLVKWMEKDFSFDRERYKKFEGTLPIPRTPEETLQLKSGIYIDAAMFSKESLNRINPSYKAQIVVIIVRPNVFNHYVCSFKKDRKLFIMDYGTPYRGSHWFSWAV